MIIGRDLMLKLGLMADFKRQVFQLGGITVPMKTQQSDKEIRFNPLLDAQSVNADCRT